MEICSTAIIYGYHGQWKLAYNSEQSSCTTVARSHPWPQQWWDRVHEQLPLRHPPPPNSPLTKLVAAADSYTSKCLLCLGTDHCTPSVSSDCAAFCAWSSEQDMAAPADLVMPPRVKTQVFHLLIHVTKTVVYRRPRLPSTRLLTRSAMVAQDPPGLAHHPAVWLQPRTPDSVPSSSAVANYSGGVRGSTNSCQPLRDRSHWLSHFIIYSNSSFFAWKAKTNKLPKWYFVWLLQVFFFMVDYGCQSDLNCYL